MVEHGTIDIDAPITPIMEVGQGGTTSNQFPLIIHVAATSATIVVVVVHLGIVPTRWSSVT